MEEQSRDELIDKYLLGGLDGDSLEEFRKKLADDAAFRKEVETHQLMFNGIRQAGRAHWKDQLDLLHAEMKRPEYPPHRIYAVRRGFWLAAACLLVLSGIFIVVRQAGHGDDRLFREYFTPYPVLEGTTRSVDSQNATPVQRAVSKYAAGDYAESIRLFNAIPGIGKEEMALFYLGNAYLANNQAGLAEGVFRKYLANYHRLASESKWYLCLSWLQQGKKEAAKLALQELELEDNSYGKKAASLLVHL